jgi:microcystin-dependent protein
MTYSVSFTESNNPAKPPIVVADGTVNETRSVSFVGQNYTGYGAIVSENFLHLLENFASPTAPTNPVQGQLWYNTSKSLLVVWDGTNWSSTGSLTKKDTPPPTGSSSVGDLWADTVNKQLYLYTGSNWVLVGPQYSSGALTGPQVEIITDTSNNDHSVIALYANNNRLAIISKESFTPKTLINGFQTVNEGMTLSTVDSTTTTCVFTGSITGSLLTITNIASGSISVGMTLSGSGVQAGTYITSQGTGNTGIGTYYVSVTQTLSSTTITATNTALTRFWGTASAADGLLVNNTVVAASNFLTTNGVTSTTNSPLSVRADGGITVGNNLSFNVGVNGNSAIFYNRTSHSSIDFLLTQGTTTNTAVHIDGLTGFVGIGPNNSSPTSTLDVLGAITAKNDTVNSLPGRVIVSGTSNLYAASTGANDPGGASIQTAGGLSVAKDALVSGNLTVNNTLYLNSLDSVTNTPQAVALILPGTDSADSTYDIGSSSRRFRNIYANTFYGAFSGQFTGYVEGSISCTAAQLASATTFQIRGDVTSLGNDVVFTGRSTTQTATFNTTISSDLITNKVAVDDSISTDQFLIYRPGSSGGLFSMTKQVLLKHVPTVPIGAIFPFAGPSTTVPSGYLLCDGAEVKISAFPQLYAIIGYNYKPSIDLVGSGTFALPDLRGRFPLGADNMNNGITVPDKNNITSQISSITTPANRVSDVTADVVGKSNGSQSVSLSVTNLPNHTHNLNSGVQQYYASGIPGGTPDPSSDAVSGFGMPSSSTGYGYKNSGGVSTNGALGTALNVMNPYQTINYIIFTGVL